MAKEILDRLAAHAAKRPWANAITMVKPLCSAPQALSYLQLHEQVVALASHLQADTSSGDVVLLCAPNRPEFAVAFLGALAAGLTVFPVHPALSAPELRAAAQRSRSRIFIGTATHFPQLRNLGIKPFDIDHISGWPAPSMKTRMPCEQAALMLQSSGTTGRPKIVYRHGRSLDAVARNVCDAVDLRQEDRILAAMPLCHSYGVENGLLAPIVAGASIHLADGFDPASVARTFNEASITIFPGVPFMFQVLAERSERIDLGSLRRAFSAGGSLPKQVGALFQRRYGTPIGQLYGSTEVGSVTFRAGPLTPDWDASVGWPMRGVSIRILDADRPQISAPLPPDREGLVVVAAPSMLDRYIDDETPSLADGFFHTGDLGFLDATGRLTITGRVKLQIDVGGLKVNPLEIEQVLIEHPSVRECVVVPMPLTQTVDRLKAIVALHNGLPEGGVEELRRYARERLASYKVPRVFEVRESLPKSPTGKILREALRCV